MRLECQNKYFQYGPKPRLIRALLYTYIDKIVYNEILLSQSVVYCVCASPSPYAGPYTYVQTIRSKNSFRILISIQIRHIINKRRLCFLHHILNLKKLIQFIRCIQNKRSGYKKGIGLTKSMKQDYFIH